MKKKKIKTCTPHNVESWKTKKQQARDVIKQRIQQLDNNYIERHLFRYF